MVGWYKETEDAYNATVPALKELGSTHGRRYECIWQCAGRQWKLQLQEVKVGLIRLNLGGWVVYDTIGWTERTVLNVVGWSKYLVVNGE